MTCLSIIQDASVSLGLSSPSAAVGQTAYLQLVALLNLEGKDLAARAPWYKLRRRNTFTLSTSSTNQGAMNGTVVTASDYAYMLQDTFYNTTTTMPIDGPMMDTDEEEQTALGFSGPYQQWALRGGDLYIYPQPTTADATAFQYVSKFWAQATGGGAKKAAFTVDTDVALLDEDLLTLGLIWRWRRANSLDYAEEFRMYESRVHDAIAREVGGKKLVMDAPRGTEYGIVIPQTGYGP
jgi:hypothetical protein